MANDAFKHEGPVMNGLVTHDHAVMAEQHTSSQLCRPTPGLLRLVFSL